MIEPASGIVAVPDDSVFLHEDILDILFRHKAEVYKKLVDLRGNFLIDHIAIKIIDPKNEIVIFSLTPSVEYNLIVQGLWRHDFSFSAVFQKNRPFYVWEEAYSKKYFHEIKVMKELKHGFTFGFVVSKKMDDFNIVYSFATRSNNRDLGDYYQNHINELLALGDYGYRLILGIYKKYSNENFAAPAPEGLCRYPSRPFLRLVTDNNS